MYQIIRTQNVGIGEWVCDRTGGTWSADATTSLGIAQDSILIAGVLYDNFNGANIQMHVAAEAGKYWLTKEFLYEVFFYPFEYLQCRRATAIIPSSNAASLNICRRLGFTQEAVLKEAHPEGDLLVFSLLKTDCKWLKLKLRGTTHGQGIRSSSTGLQSSRN